MRGVLVCGIQDQHSVGIGRKGKDLPGFTHAGRAVSGLPNVRAGKDEVYQYLDQYTLAV